MGSVGSFVFFFFGGGGWGVREKVVFFHLPSSICGVSWVFGHFRLSLSFYAYPLVRIRSFNLSDLIGSGQGGLVDFCFPSFLFFLFLFFFYIPSLSYSYLCPRICGGATRVRRGTSCAVRLGQSSLTGAG
jgi:hypothetical protein